MGCDCVQCNHWDISLLRLLGCSGGSLFSSGENMFLSEVYVWLYTYKLPLKKVFVNFGCEGEPEPLVSPWSYALATGPWQVAQPCLGRAEVGVAAGVAATGLPLSLVSLVSSPV